ncbi:MAG: sulfur oxidation c-type cytochrome SoxA [Proteobacteria bacterium]|nr:MAG: sulfur oxidation c-type cytochrome SoxA [Pseudomonadota bacterium]QKK10786.1 MAG: sulfur oxidation c-type cytochrome SoxA [Pseudomonadota bacterium]
MKTLKALVAMCGLLIAANASAQSAVSEEFQKFRSIMEEDNPAELFEAIGEEYWYTKAGPRNASLEACDLGLGPGVIKGAYAQMPRYFADVDQIMDAETRIVHCMETLQGFSHEEVTKQPFSNDKGTPNHVSVLTYVASQSKGMPIALPQSHPKEREAYAVGKEMFNYRAGPYDFSCATCHGTEGKRIRMQDLPNLTTRDGAAKSVLGWPGYRITGGRMLTLQWRMNDCFRQQRFPQPKYVSEAVSVLLTYMGVTANGTMYTGPGIKR